jgi:hypothetical protein
VRIGHPAVAEHLVIAGAMTYTVDAADPDVHRLDPATRRALALAVVGLLAATAALSSDPTRAGGLDAALRSLGETALGASLLVVVAAAFAAFGLRCFADAATRRA